MEWSLVRFQKVSLEFFIDIILPIALWSWSIQPRKEMSKSDSVKSLVCPKGWVEVQLYSSMTAALEGGWSGQQHDPVALYPRERLGTHCTGGWVGPRVGVEGRKFSSPLGFDPGPSSS